MRDAEHGSILPSAFDFSVEQPISTDIALYGGVFAKRHVIPVAGTYVPQHAHAYDHLSLLTVGAMRAWCDGKLVGDFTAPAEIRIPARSLHTFLTLVDGTTFYCLHNADRFEEEERHELPGAPAAPATEAAAPREDDDGVVIAEEAFATFWRDGQALFAEHIAEVGSREGVSLDINVPLIEKLEELGATQILTARCNGRLFGYLATVITPSLEDRNLTVAAQNTFFVSKDFRGLGPRLQRASLDLLRARGVGEVIMRAGVRGSGPKLGALYKRMGATEYGQLFSLILKAA